jgi:hypothetical protein
VECLLAKVGVIARGQEDDRHILQGLTSAQAQEQLEPVDSRAF